MTDRIKGFYVSLDKDYRDDGIQEIVKAVKMIKGVQDVSLSVVDGDDWMDRSRIAREYRSKIFEALRDLE